MKKLTVALAMIAAAIVVPATLFAWGPARSTYTIEKPADHITFNSITNNPNYGDERNFVNIKTVENRDSAKWVDELSVENGKEYYVRMYVHNNAAANLNLVAKSVTAKFNIPDFNANRVQIDGYLSATNATPTQVWDQAVFTSDKSFNMQYVAGSATYTNNVHTDGITLSDSVASTGALLGYNTLNGDIPGCFQYSGLVIFKVKATVVTPTIEKTVRVSGTTDKTFKESISVEPGTLVDYQIHYKNTSGVEAKEVVVKDTLPAGVTYVAGTSYLLNSGGSKKIADGITAGGAIIGSYNDNGDAYIKFTAKVADNESLAKCGVNTLVNTAIVTTDLGSGSDTADVTVNKDCKPNECKPGIPEGDKRCETPPVTPPELPKTGPSENIVAIFGLGALITSIGYYRASRRTLMNK